MLCLQVSVILSAVLRVCVLFFPIRHRLAPALVVAPPTFWAIISIVLLQLN